MSVCCDHVLYPGLGFTPTSHREAGGPRAKLTVQVPPLPRCLCHNQVTHLERRTWRALGSGRPEQGPCWHEGLAPRAWASAPASTLAVLPQSANCIFRELLSSAVAAPWQEPKAKFTVCGIYKQPAIRSQQERLARTQAPLRGLASDLAPAGPSGCPTRRVPLTSSRDWRPWPCGVAL